MWSLQRLVPLEHGFQSVSPLGGKIAGQAPDSPPARIFTLTTKLFAIFQLRQHSTIHRAYNHKSLLIHSTLPYRALRGHSEQSAHHVCSSIHRHCEILKRRMLPLQLPSRAFHVLTWSWTASQQGLLPCHRRFLPLDSSTYSIAN